MESNTIQKAPPMLPAQWSSSYISYWQPMKPEEHITSGYCWFDYSRNMCRIDGLFNPWSERETGHRLWMSEVMNPQTGESYKSKIAYSRENMEQISEFSSELLTTETDACHELILEQDALHRYNAEFIGTSEILGQQADGWQFQRPNGKGPATYFFVSGTEKLIRMVTGDPKVLASIRDFPNFSQSHIKTEIFDSTM